MRKLDIIKAVSFLLIATAVTVFISKLFLIGENVQWIAGFYAERENSLDAVFIGASNVFSYWQAPLAWNKYGIAVWPFASSGQSLDAAEYIIKETRKTQPNALYIVCVNGVESPVDEANIHYLVDFIPYSENKRQLINCLADVGKFEENDRLEYYFPLLRFHSRWDEIMKNYADIRLNGLKGGVIRPYFLDDAADVTENFEYVEERYPLRDRTARVLTRLLDYCDSEKINVLFVVSPQVQDNKKLWGWVNTVGDIVTERGYPFLDTRKHIDEIGLDLTSDYYNVYHTNIHGSSKFTDYFARYLTKNYDFEDKRGNKSYKDWDIAYDKYCKIIDGYTMPFEYSGEERNLSLSAPILSDKNKLGEMSWNAIEGADGYGIFRQEGSKAWRLLETVDADVLSWRCSDQGDYTYMVVAYVRDGNLHKWGNYDVLRIANKYEDEY